MKYDLLSKIYYSNRDSYESFYQERFQKGVKLDIDINGFRAFFSDETDIYRKLLEIERINSNICYLAGRLPGVALAQYESRCLIDEIILTNDIEGVYSTRKEIGTILNELEEKNKKNRFYGLVNKYVMLNKGGIIPLNTSKDVRDLYDELFLNEVAAEDPGDVPDGNGGHVGLPLLPDSGYHPCVVLCDTPVCPEGQSGTLRHRGHEKDPPDDERPQV